MTLLDKDIRYPGIGETALTALIGFMIVFVGIAILVGIVWLVGRIMQKANEKQKPVQKETKPVQKQSDGLDEETVAVIMASLMAYYAEQNRKCEFTVKRIKRI